MRFLRIVLGIAVTGAGALLALVFYERYWRWRDCFNELGRCYDPASQTVMTDAGFVWGLMAVVAFGLALALWMLGRRR